MSYVNRSRRVRGATTALHAGLLVGGVFVALPVLWAVTSSIKTAGQIFSVPPSLIPTHPTFDNYVELFRTSPVAQWLLNSLAIAAVVTTVGVVISAMGGFALAKYVFVGRELSLRVIVASLAIPFITLLVPLYVVISKLGLVDTYLGVIIPQVVQPFGVFLMRQYINQTVPDEILDSARIDGAGEFRIFRSIVLPVVRPGLAVLGIWLFLASFNNFLWPLMVLSGPSRLTLPVGLAGLTSGQGVQYGTVMAGVVVTLVPPLVVFIGLQRQFIQGLTRGAVVN